MKKLLTYGGPVLAGLLILPVPLLRDFHFESAMLVALAGSYWAAVSASLHSNASDLFRALRILGLGYLFGMPLFFYSVLTGCLSFDGIGFWLFIPGPSIFLGQAIGRLIREFRLPFPRTLSVMVITTIALGVWIVEFFTLPQVYFFNHIWGIWPGPIYDEAVRLDGSLIFFRWITLLWILLLWVLPEWNRSSQNKLLLSLVIPSLLLSYLNLVEMGIVTPREHLKSVLSGHIQTPHIDLYYDPVAFPPDEARYWALRHEFHFQQITGLLNIEWPEGRKIESYLYGNPWQKKELVGAKFTSYVPIWLEQDQLHIARQQLEGVLKHELVHVISKQFGNQLFHGSWSIGMIEGLAEAIAKDASPQSTLEQIIAAEPPYPTHEEMRRAFSNTGFYGNASSISYTTAGAFTEFLLSEYSPESFKSAYPDLDFQKAYGVPFDTLVSRWKESLPPVKVDSVDRQISEFIFAQRSLFQRSCPHSVSRPLQLWDDYLYHEALGDSSRSLESIKTLYTLDPTNPLVKREWSTLMLKSGTYRPVYEAITESDSSLTLQLIKGDALILDGRRKAAERHLREIKPRLDRSRARNLNYSYALRSDSLFWTAHTNRRYRNILPELSVFERLNYPNQILSIARAAELDQYTLLSEYSRILLDEPASSDWFDLYEAMLEELIYNEAFNLAEQWLQKISSLDLRARYRERLQETKEWKAFLEDSDYLR